MEEVTTADVIAISSVDPETNPSVMILVASATVSNAKPELKVKIRVPAFTKSAALDSLITIGFCRAMYSLSIQVSILSV